MSTRMYNYGHIARGGTLRALVFHYYASSDNGQVLYVLFTFKG